MAVRSPAPVRRDIHLTIVFIAKSRQTRKLNNKYVIGDIGQKENFLLSMKIL